MAKFLTLFSLLSLTGCVSNSAILTDSTGIPKQSCKSDGFGIAGVFMANSHFTDCVERAKMKGLVLKQD